MNAITLKRCIGCGNEFKVDARIKKDRKYCSAACYRRHCVHVKNNTVKKDVVVKRSLLRKIISYLF